MVETVTEPGQAIDNARLCEIFKCSTQGGMRRSRATNSLVLVSNHVKSLYGDRWIADTFHYTGMGLEGDQQLGFAQNRTLAESPINGIEVHLFEVFEKGLYTYDGRVQLAGEPYQEVQLDSNDSERHVWMFPLRLVDAEVPPMDSRTLQVLEEKHRARISKLPLDALERLARTAPRKSGGRRIQVTSYMRHSAVSEYAKRRANGICQLCKQPAPFQDKHGEPYLETHHIVWLARGGEDSIENTVALCPNCHRRMHALDHAEDRDRLRKIAGA